MDAATGTARTAGSTSLPRPRSLIRDLPLSWKLLVPFIALILCLGLVGGFLIVRDLSSRAQASLNQDLLRLSVEAGSFVRDRELYLLESVNFASNLNGMADAVASRSKRATSRFLGSVLALKPDLDLLAVTDRHGTLLSRYSGGRIISATGPDRSTRALSRDAFRSGGTKVSGLVVNGGQATLAIGAPVCSAPRRCSPVGAAVVGMSLKAIVTSTATESTQSGPRTIATYGKSGRLLSSSGPAAASLSRSDSRSTNLVRLRQRVGSSDVAALLAPLYVQGRRVGTLSVSVPASHASSGSVRGTALRLGLLLLAALAGIVAIGAILSRWILRQVRSLVVTNRSLAEGDLSARAPVLSADELGELAGGVNQMAARLQTSVETLEQRVDERTEEVQRLLRERTDFFAAASHDFRTPLAVILRQADVLRSAEYASAERREIAAGRLTEAGEHLLVLVNDILAMAEAEAGVIEIDLREVRLSEVIDEVRQTIDGLARGYGMSVLIDADRKLPPVRADRARLREIILNLVDNAVKYTPDGGTIELKASAHNGMVHVSVSDSGVGIPHDVGERIFEPFYRVKNIAPQHGQASSGLGLALTKRLVEAHGGRIWYEPRTDGGTTFTFTLTRARRSPARPRRRLEQVRDAG